MFGSEQKRPATENWSKLSTLWGKRLVIFGLKYNATKETSKKDGEIVLGNKVLTIINNALIVVIFQ